MLLFDKIVFGPITSRRLGRSLGVNLLPCARKICSFNCIYCECGLNPKGPSNACFPEVNEVTNLLELKLKELSENKKNPDSITFAGNGEPTLHPNFLEIIDKTIILRDLYCPKTRVTVLSNSSRIHIPEVFEALLKVDNNIQKLDSAFPETVKLLNNPEKSYNLDRTIEYLKKFAGKVIIQTLFVKGMINGVPIDNSTDIEVDAWLKLIKEISPRYVMIYQIDRETPVETLEKISPERLNEIAKRGESVGIKLQVTN